jgi:hypothetical protein
MQLLSGHEAEYRQKHDGIWPHGTPWSEPIGELFHLA